MQFWFLHRYIVAIYRGFKYGTLPVIKINDFIDWSLPLESYNSNTLNLATILYTYNFYLFILIGLILLVAMIGAIALVLSRRVFAQSVYKQILRKPTVNWMGYSDQHTQRYLSKIRDDLKNF